MVFARDARRIVLHGARDRLRPRSGPHPPEHDATRRMGSLIPSADIARLTQLRSDGSERDVCHLSPGRHLTVGRERGSNPFLVELA